MHKWPRNNFTPIPLLLCKFNSLEEDLTEKQLKLDRLIAEKDQVRDIVRDEFSDRLVLLEDENSRIKREQSEARARQKLELDNLKSKQEEELRSVHERLKQALGRKDESIQAVKRQQEMADKRAKHLEELLEEQRKLILKQ